MRKKRELMFQGGLILAAIVAGKLLDSPVGYVLGGILAIAFITQWVLQRDEGDQEVQLEGLFGGQIPADTVPKAEQNPPNFALNRVSMGAIWWDKSVGYFKREAHPPESSIATFMEIGNESIQGKDTGPAGKVRAQMVLKVRNGGEYRASPCAWINEPYSCVDFGIADTRWLIIAVGLGQTSHWVTVVNRRTGASDPQWFEYNNDIPGGGVMDTEGTILIDLVSSQSGDILISYELGWRWNHGDHFWISFAKQL